MATVVLVRHGRSTSNTAKTLAGRTPGVHLDDVGREQAAATRRLLQPIPLVRVVASPLERCQQTAEALVSGRGLAVGTCDDLTECGYGDWSGREIAALAQEPLWTTVQHQPSAVTFPGGESIAAMQARAVAAVRAIDAEVEAAHGKHAVWCAVSHGDVIKSILADACGTHLDAFQRIVVDPASVSVVRYTSQRPYVLRQNVTDGLASVVPAPEASDDAVVGGTTGTERA